MKKENQGLFFTIPATIGNDQIKSNKSHQNKLKPNIKLGFSESEKLERPTNYTKAI